MVGLGVTALHTVRVLRRAGIAADAQGVWTADDVHAALLARPETTHCVIEAPWVPLGETEKLLARFPRVHFLVRSHSQIGFLQIEPGAITLLRDLAALEDHALNLSVATNSRSLKAYLEGAYGSHALYLPNLYDLPRVRRRRDAPHASRLLRVGSFGAMRLLKNHTTAAAAALMLARERDADLELWLTVDQETEGGHGVLASLRAMFAGLGWAKLVEAPWQDWSRFRTTAAAMDLAIFPSMTETFNMSCADAVAEGVPCVVGPAIEWAPAHWKAETDRLEDIVRVGRGLLAADRGAAEGLAALERYVDGATAVWQRYLAHPPDQARVRTA